MAQTKVEGLERLRAKVLERLPAEAKRAIAEANQKNAHDMAALVLRTIPRGNPADGALADSVGVVEGAQGDGAYLTTIGSAKTPYVLHLEAGHRNADGTHTPGKPFWNPSKRVVKKRARGRAARALTKAVKAVTG